MSGFNVQLQLAGVLEWMSQQMAGCGGKTAVIGISGGKDSSTVAAMAVAAYGRDHVYGRADARRHSAGYRLLSSAGGASADPPLHLQHPRCRGRGYCPSWSRRA